MSNGERSSLENYEVTPNSRKYKDQIATASTATDKTARPRVTPVVAKGRAHTKKPGFFAKLRGNLISEDASSVKGYIIGDVLIPSFKKAISDIVVDGIDIILYGEAGRGRRRNNSGRVEYSRSSYVDVNRRYSSYRTDEKDSSRRTSRTESIYEDIIVDTKREADDILEKACDYLDSYSVISVADVYELANQDRFPHSAHNWGWTNVASARVIRVNDGFLIKMPPVESIK